VFVAISHSHPSLLFAGEAGAYLSGDLYPFSHKYLTMVEGTEVNKHSSLLQYG